VFSAGVQLNIFQFLPPKDLFYACQACKGIYQALNPFNHLNSKTFALRYQHQYSSTAELQEQELERMMRVKKGTTTPVASVAAESEDDELLIRMKLPHLIYPGHTHFYELGYFHFGMSKVDHCDFEVFVVCIEDETGQPIMTSEHIGTESKSNLAFYPSCDERVNYFLNIRMAPSCDWHKFSDQCQLYFRVDALIFGIGLIQLHKEAHAYLKSGTISWNVIEQVLHDKTISTEKKIEALLVTALNTYSLLHVATKENNISAMKLLLGYCRKESFVAKYAPGGTPIGFAARAGNDEALKLMIEVGGKEAVTAENEWGFTALHSAALEGNINALKILLEAGGKESVRKKNSEGHTPLYCAVAYGHNEALPFLLEADGGISALIQDKNGMIPLHASLRDHNFDIVETLVKAGGNEACLVRDVCGNTPLHYAAYDGNTPAIKIMLECVGKEALMMINTSGHTPVAAAASRHHLDATTLLLMAESEEENNLDATDPNTIRERQEAKNKREEGIRKCLQEQDNRRRREMEESFLLLSSRK